MKKTILIVITGILLLSFNVFAQDDVSINSSGNVTTGVTNVDGNLEVEGASGEDAIVGRANDTGAAAVYGAHNTAGTIDNYGILGDDNYGVFGHSPGGYAGYFEGDVYVTGKLGAGTFSINETDPTVNALGKATLICSSGQIVKLVGANWICASDSDTLMLLSCGDQQIAKWNGTNWMCASDIDTNYSAGTGLDLIGTNFSVEVPFVLIDSFASGGVISATNSDIDGYGVYGVHSASGGTAPGILGESNSTSSYAAGIVGKIVSTTPGSYSAGIRGINNGTGTTGIGVYGTQDGSGWGVFGMTPGGRGVFGYASGTSDMNYGVYGQTNSTTGYGVYGVATALSGVNIGVYGTTYSPSGYAGFFDGRVTAAETIESWDGFKFPDGTVQTTAAPPAGQYCLPDSLVIGFDDNGQIVCTLDTEISNSYWASMADYVAGILTVELNVKNPSGITVSGVSLISVSATDGVTLATSLPLSIGNMAGGSTVTITLTYNVPAGISSFKHQVFDVRDTNSVKRTRSYTTLFEVNVPPPPA